MADIGENLRSVIVGSTAIRAVLTGYAAPGAVTQEIEMENAPVPRIWYGRGGEENERELDGTSGLITSQWNVEVISDDLDECQDIAAAVRGYLDAKRGAFGTQTVLGTLVEEQNDEYTPQGVGSEEGFNVAALSVTIYYAST